MLCSKCQQTTDNLTREGLCEDCHMQAESRRLEIIALASKQCHTEGQVEIDDDARLSEGNDNGCYVQASVWVDFAGTKFEKG